MENLFTKQSFRLIKGHYPILLDQFAIDDTLTERVGQKMSAPILRYWVMDHHIALGIKDSKLPHLKEGISYLEGLGYDVLIRPSGGLAVVLDSGIMNLSLILPEDTYHVDLDRGFLMMVTLMKLLLEPYGATFETGEIKESYCPGKYDLSINGKKFAGLSQRRIKGGVNVLIYICVSGSGSVRARLIQTFYEKSINHDETSATYPSVNPDTMASLSELLGFNLSCHDLFKQLLTVLLKRENHIFHEELREDEKQRFDYYLERMRQREERFSIT